MTKIALPWQGIISAHPSAGCENMQSPQVVIRLYIPYTYIRIKERCSLLVIAVTAAIVCANR